jgi:DNA-binding transcriptional ArsR family regulator
LVQLGIPILHVATRSRVKLALEPSKLRELLPRQNDALAHNLVFSPVPTISMVARHVIERNITKRKLDARLGRQIVMSGAPPCERRSVPQGFGTYMTLIHTLYFDIVRTMKSKNAIESLAALAQESRLAIFRMLVKRGPEGYTPTQLGEKLSVAPATLSFHLKELQRAGLVDVRRDGRFLYYRPNFTHMNRLVGFLTENCCLLADQGCGPECAPVEAEVSLTKRQRA